MLSYGTMASKQTAIRHSVLKPVSGTISQWHRNLRPKGSTKVETSVTPARLLCNVVCPKVSQLINVNNLFPRKCLFKDFSSKRQKQQNCFSLKTIYISPHFFADIVFPMKSCTCSDTQLLYSYQNWGQLH